MKEKMMKEKSLKKNIGFYMIKQLSALLLPMIVYPYVLRKLGADSLGQVEYAKSVVNYFVLISGLGIADYAIREGARIRDEKEKMNQFATQLLLLHTFAAGLAVLGGVLLTFCGPFREYAFLMRCFLMTIPFSVIGMNWIFGIYEEYQYISVRTVCFQIFSAILTFCFIKDEQDYVSYAIILAFSGIGSNLINLKKIPEYMHLDLRNFSVSEHLKPVFYIFAMALASNIYMTMDVSMLGFLAGTEYVGLYAAANKLIIVIGTCVAAVRTVLLPRLSYMMGKKEHDGFQKLNTNSLKIMLALAIPAAIGIFGLSEWIIKIFCGQGFEASVRTLRLLSPEIILSVLSGYMVYQVLMPLKKEKQACFCIVLGAAVNLICNYFMIPVWKQDGAAIATCISELVVFVSSFCMAKSCRIKNVE